MRAVLPPEGGEVDALGVTSLPTPVPGPGEVLLRVSSAALNRADFLQIRGLYPPPPGASPVLGLECAGVIEAFGPGAAQGGSWRVGDRAMALLAGGGLAEWVAVPVGQLLPVPDGLSLTQAAALPEAALTSWTNLVAEGRLAPGETVLIAGATSGIGLFAVQLARELGARVVAAGRTRERVERLRELGADEVCVFGDGFLDAVRQASGGRGVDLVMDLVGGAWFSDHLRVLRREGRLVLVGLMAGGRAEVDLGVVLMRRLEVRGSVLRSRPVGEKAALVGDFWAFAGERLGDGRLRGVVDRVVSLDSVREGYLAMLAGGLWGKIVVEVGGV